MPAEQAILTFLRHALRDVDLGDDAYYDPQRRLILTTDMLVDGTHFNRVLSSAYDIGWKALAVNLSDVAAMGGEPCHALVSMGLPLETEMEWIKGLYAGLLACADTFACKIVGGDTVRSDAVVINVAMTGELPAEATLGRRNKARAGDWIVTTGYSGLSAGGLYVLKEAIKDYPALVKAHLQPVPCLREGRFLSTHYRHYALMDTSDGLADAALKIAQESQMVLVIEGKRVPRHPELDRLAKKEGISPWPSILYGGEDFELLACLPSLPPAESGFYPIGRVEAPTAQQPAGSAWLEQDNGREALSMKKTYQHFARPTLPVAHGR